MLHATNMKLLSEVRDKFMKGLEVKLPVDRLAGLDIEALERVMQKFPGKHGVRFRFIDPAENMESDAISRRLTVSATDDFFKAMEQEVGIEVGLV